LGIRRDSLLLRERRDKNVGEEMKPVFLPKRFEGLLEDNAGMVFVQIWGRR
jgi:hypothetical protein